MTEKLLLFSSLFNEALDFLLKILDDGFRNHGPGLDGCWPDAVLHAHVLHPDVVDVVDDAELHLSHKDQ